MAHVLPKFRVVTKMPYFNHTREFFTFDEMQAWLFAAIGRDVTEHYAQLRRGLRALPATD